MGCYVEGTENQPPMQGIVRQDRPRKRTVGAAEEEGSKAEGVPVHEVRAGCAAGHQVLPRARSFRPALSQHEGWGVSRASAVGKMGRWVPALLAPPRSARTTAAHLEASTGDKEAGSPCQQYEIAGADDDGNHADPWADLGA